jgi:hypothetical protein
MGQDALVICKICKEVIRGPKNPHHWEEVKTVECVCRKCQDLGHGRPPASFNQVADVPRLISLHRFG